MPRFATLRTEYVHESYEDTMEDYKNLSSNEYLWISDDKTIDAKGQQIANINNSIWFAKNIYKNQTILVLPDFSNEFHYYLVMLFRT